VSDVVVARWIAASPPTVFAFFTDVERWTAWQGVGGTVDARAGGSLRVIMPDAAAASGRFIEVVPPRRIVFTWGWEGNGIPIPPGSSIVTIELEPAGSGTMVRLTHSGLQPADVRELHRSGWERYLDRLARRATGEDPGPDRYDDLHIRLSAVAWWPWLATGVRSVGVTIRGRIRSSGPGSPTSGRVGSIWLGCAGRTGSPVQTAAAAATGGPAQGCGCAPTVG